MLCTLRKNYRCGVDAQYGEHGLIGDAVDWKGSVGLEGGDEGDRAFTEYAIDCNALFLRQLEICIEGSL